MRTATLIALLAAGLCFGGCNKKESTGEAADKPAAQTPEKPGKAPAAEAEQPDKASKAGGEKPLPRASSADSKGKVAKAVAEIEALADKVCACKDPECAQGAAQELMKVAQANREVPADARGIEAIEKATKRFSRCMAQVARRAGAIPTPEPKQQPVLPE